jgi:hypothetical protein
MTEPCGIDIIVAAYIGARVDFHKEKEPLRIVAYPLALLVI